MINSTSSTSYPECGSITTTHTYLYGVPELIETREVDETIELTYLEQLNASLTWNPLHQSKRVFKIIYSCKDGKWNKSERIYGEVIPASGEWYSFE